MIKLFGNEKLAGCCLFTKSDTFFGGVSMTSTPIVCSFCFDSVDD